MTHQPAIEPLGPPVRISHLPEPRLLDAAHIVMDADEQLGQPIVSNGLPLSKIHHKAFDAHLIGVDPDFCLHVFDRLLEIHDGPFLVLRSEGDYQAGYPHSTAE
jgi:putative restriction endonuclease